MNLDKELVLRETILAGGPGSGRKPGSGASSPFDADPSHPGFKAGKQVAAYRAKYGSDGTNVQSLARSSVLAHNLGTMQHMNDNDSAIHQAQFIHGYNSFKPKS
jgi:hypothetical protein